MSTHERRLVRVRLRDPPFIVGSSWQREKV
jgi:hypothetical protein